MGLPCPLDQARMSDPIDVLQNVSFGGTPPWPLIALVVIMHVVFSLFDARALLTKEPRPLAASIKAIVLSAAGFFFLWMLTGVFIALPVAIVGSVFGYELPRQLRDDRVYAARKLADVDETISSVPQTEDDSGLSRFYAKRAEALSERARLVKRVAELDNESPVSPWLDASINWTAFLVPAAFAPATIISRARRRPR